MLRPPGTISSALRRRLLLALVALLPLHTVFVHAWVAWKPWLLVLIALVTLQAWDGWTRESWPWHGPLSVGVAALLGALAISGPPIFTARFAGLWLATAVGGAILLSVHREITEEGDRLDAVLRTVFWSGAALGITAIGISLTAVGAFGSGAVRVIEDLPIVERVVKAAYLEDGFLALTNWHTDPGYAATWMNLWLVLAIVAATRGLGTGRAWLDATVVGGLAFGVIMTLSRTGLLGLAVGLSLSLWLAVRERQSLARALKFHTAVVIAAAALLATTLFLDRPDVGSDLGEAISFRLGQGITLGPGVPQGPGLGLPGDHRSVVWPVYWQLFMDDPLRGAGLGHGWASGFQEPHNLVLQLLGESGLVGLAGFAVLFGVVLHQTRSRLGVVVLGTTMSAAITQTVLFEPTWWFAAAIAVGARTVRGSREPEA